MCDKKLVKGIVAFSKERYNDYRKILSLDDEWPGIDINVNKGSRVTFDIPILITELYRFVPYKEGRFVSFHPFNMPRIKIRKIDLVGIVLNIRRDMNNLFLTIQDGTGVAEINFKLEQYTSLLKQRQEIDDKYRKRAMNLEKGSSGTIKDHSAKFPLTRPGFSYSTDVCLQDVAVLENKWWLETNGGLLGKQVQLCDYVYINGYPCLDTRFQNIPQEITAQFIQHARLTVFAVSVTCISEETYNNKLSMWINTTICQRYKKVEKQHCVEKTK